MAARPSPPPCGAWLRVGLRARPSLRPPRVCVARVPTKALRAHALRAAQTVTPPRVQRAQSARLAPRRARGRHLRCSSAPPQGRLVNLVLWATIAPRAATALCATAASALWRALLSAPRARRHPCAPWARASASRTPSPARTAATTARRARAPMARRRASPARLARTARTQLARARRRALSGTARTVSRPPRVSSAVRGPRPSITSALPAPRGVSQTPALVAAHPHASCAPRDGTLRQTLHTTHPERPRATTRVPRALRRPSSAHRQSLTACRARQASTVPTSARPCARPQRRATLRQVWAAPTRASALRAPFLRAPRRCARSAPPAPFLSRLARLRAPPPGAIGVHTMNLAAATADSVPQGPLRPTCPPRPA